MHFNKGLCKVFFVAEPQQALHNGSQNWHQIEFATGPLPIYNNCLPVPKPTPCPSIALSLHIYHPYCTFAPFTGTRPTILHGEAKEVTSGPWWCPRKTAKMYWLNFRTTNVCSNMLDFLFFTDSRNLSPCW